MFLQISFFSTLVVTSFAARCPGLSQIKSRCGPMYGRCNEYLDSNSKYCNTDTEVCGSSSYRAQQNTDIYDWAPRSCNRGIENEGSKCSWFWQCSFGDSPTANGPCDWCGWDGMCCRNGQTKNGCDGKMGGHGEHICVLNPGISQRQPDCTSSKDCPTGSFCSMDYGDTGYCEECRSIEMECQNAGFATSEGVEECQFMCEDHGCYNTADCQDASGGYEGTASFCNYDLGDKGFCEFCSGFPDGCEGQGLINQMGEFECKQICENSLCENSTACPGMSFCNFDHESDGLCEYCSDIQDCESESFINGKGNSECKKVCEADKSLWRILEANNEGCNSAQGWSNDTICSGAVKREPKFVLNLANPQYDIICNFIALEMKILFPILPKGVETCKAITSCIVEAFKGNFDGDECVNDAMDGMLQDVNNSMDKLRTGVRQAAGMIEQLVGDVACNTDPGLHLLERKERIKALVKAFKDLPETVKRVSDTLKEVFVPSEDLGGGEKCSVLLSLDESAVLGDLSQATSIGAFVTFNCQHIRKLHMLGPIVEAAAVIEILFDDDTEVGLYQAFADGQTSAIGASVGVGATVQFLQGDIGVWGGYGFDISVDVQTEGMMVGVTVGLVFSARPMDHSLPNGRQVTDHFIGFMLGASVGVGLVDFPVAISRSCGFIRNATLNDYDYSQCEVHELDDVKKEWNEWGQKMKDDFNNLVEKCKNAWTCRFENCKESAYNAARDAEDCFAGRMKKCFSFRLGQCLNWGHCISRMIGTTVWECADSLAPFHPINCDF